MTPEEYSFFAEHIENFLKLTDIVESMVDKMAEMDKRITYLEKGLKYNPPKDEWKKDKWDDKLWEPVLA